MTHEAQINRLKSQLTFIHRHTAEHTRQAVSTRTGATTKCVRTPKSATAMHFTCGFIVSAADETPLSTRTQNGVGRLVEATDATIAGLHDQQDRDL
ncbi:MAG: hypothetical protein AAFU50_08905 [Pseudomonadota bacterium]